MKLTVLVLFLLISTHVIFAQKGSWEIGPHLTFGTCIPVLSKNNSNEVRVNSNPAVLQFSTGLFARKFFKQNYGFEFAAQVSSFGLRSWKNVEQLDMNGNSLGFVSFTDRRSYWLAEIPLRFVYKKSIKRIDIGGFAGFSPSILLDASQTKSNNGGTVNHMSSTYNINDVTHMFNVFADIGFLFRVNVYKNLYFEAKPILRMSVAAMQKPDAANDYTERFMSVGSTLGVAWRL